jgi:PAS domain S-box-containing protein
VQRFRRRSADGPWRETALKQGFRSTASFPFKADGATVGALVLFAGELDYFKEDEIELMDRVAEELSFAIESLQKERKRQQAEALLQASEASMAVAQRMAHLGSWELDLTAPAGDGQLRWSDELFRIVGHEPGMVEVSNDLFFRLVHPDDREPVRQAVAKAIRERGPYSIVHRFIRPDGSVRIVHETALISFDEPAGLPLKIVGTCQDITESSLAEAKLRGSEALLRLSGRAAHLGGWSIQLPDRSLVWSEESCAIHDLPADHRPTLEEGIGYYPAEHRAEVLRHVDACARNGTGFDFDLPKITATGRRIWVRSIGEAVRDAGGRIVSVQGAFQDISERKHAEVETRLNAQRYRTLVEATTSIVWDTPASGEFEVEQPGWAAFTGQSFEEYRGWGWLNAVHPDDQAETGRIWSAAVASRGIYQVEHRLRFHDRTYRYMLARSVPILAEDGSILQWIGIHTDVTEQKRLAAQFLRAQRMESIGTLAGGIAHDLNNMLAPIMMSVDLLKMNLGEKKRLEILSTIKTCVTRGADMVGQMLSFARGVEGRRLAVQPRHLLRDAAKIANDTFPKNILVRTVIRAEPETVSGDDTQLHQVLLNLCVNARDAMPEGGALTLSAENVELDQHYIGLNSEGRPGPHVVIQVEDTGSGMPQTIIDKIFEPFFTTKEMDKGTGLGLSTSLAIVKSHGGFIRVYSEPGKGTKFLVHLPAQAGLLPDPRFIENELPRGDGELVLVVDDEASVRQITRQTLEAFGYRVVLASDGAEALAIYTTQKDGIAVVLTDMMMPVMDGPALIKALLKLNPEARIIAASGLNADGRAAKATSAGVKHFLPKPYTSETLLKALRQSLQMTPENAEPKRS